jgi:hypothetical protein
VYRKGGKVILVFKGICDRKVAVLVGFPYKNLKPTLACWRHLLSPTVSEANREGWPTIRLNELIRHGHEWATNDFSLYTPLFPRTALPRHSSEYFSALVNQSWEQRTWCLPFWTAFSGVSSRGVMSSTPPWNLVALAEYGKYPVSCCRGNGGVQGTFHLDENTHLALKWRFGAFSLLSKAGAPLLCRRSY